ncbi:MAG TPA: ABC transporter ATP-binding protein [Methylomirabilota bacterium]|jgi:NitT/TauT family transport system ATP-binding protein|nr:ABC transporter ATP-binding protein [Methylomirabilota bacterium]
MPAIITLKNITKYFQEDHKNILVLNDISLEIQAGEFFILVGPSGSGKSTILRVASGLEKSFKGQVVLSPEVKKGDMSFVFQQFALLPWLTVYENIELGLLAKKISPKVKHEIVNRELKQFGLEKFARSYPKDLSGGMRQRVGIARALAPDPKIIFMDEPFSELDSFTAEELRQELLQIWIQRKPTIIMVTHIVAEALELADRVAVLTPRPARVEKILKNTLPRPRQMRSSDFFLLEDQLYQLIKP